MIAIPTLPAGFTRELLTTLLRAHGCLPASGEVTTVAQSQIGAGTGMMAELARLTLTYSGDSGLAPKTLVAKFSSQNPTNREISMSYNLYERETRFFQEVAPNIQTTTPAVYFAGFKGDRFLILMQDLASHEVGSQVVGADLEQTELAIDELVKLHAPLLGKTDALTWVPTIYDSYHADNMVAFCEIGGPVTQEKFASVLADEYVERFSEFSAALPTLQQFMNAGPTTLCHGDYRMENLLYASGQGTREVVVIDWQGPLRARGMNDVSLFLAQSTQTSVRRDHEHALIERYVKGLAAEGVASSSVAEAFEEYRRSILYNWVYVTVVAGTLDTSDPTAYAWMAQMVERQSAASDDLGVFQLL